MPREGGFGRTGEIGRLGRVGRVARVDASDAGRDLAAPSDVGRDLAAPSDAAPDQVAVEALLVDRYLDALLAAAERRAADAPADALLDPSLRGLARRLSSELVRVHPSFRFEERLAARLAAAADAMRPETAGPVRLHVVPGRTPARRSRGRTRGLVVGGALTSAALSLAGAAFLAWRRRGSADASAPAAAETA